MTDTQTVPKRDVIIIGAGPAGYVCAIRCAQLGLNTLVVDDRLDDRGAPSLGGTCLNVGCIPSKALLDSSEKFHAVLSDYAAQGIKAQGVKLDLPTMMAHKDEIVRNLTQGISTLFKANGIETRSGQGRLLGKQQVRITDHKGNTETFRAKDVVLATGSTPIDIASAPMDGERIIDSTGALAFDAVPKRLAVIGAGVIGLELGSVWNRLGSKVILLEARDEFLPMADRTVARTALKAMRDAGLDIRLGARVTKSGVTKSKATSQQVTVSYSAKDGEHRIAVDKVLVAVGRTAHSAGLAADEAELLLDEAGMVHVDQHCRTNLPNVWAIGDLVRGPMLAHKGSEEGVMVAERIAGHATEIEYDHIPSVLYTHPEVAWAGLTEQQLKAKGIPFKTGRFPFAANGRAKAQGDTEGFVKIIAHADTDRLLGVHIIGPSASELIAEAVVTMAFEGSAEDLARTVHAHPTLSESVHEAALGVSGRALHSFSR